LYPIRAVAFISPVLSTAVKLSRIASILVHEVQIASDIIKTTTVTNHVGNAYYTDKGAYLGTYG
jgi:hypothetical protein